MKYKAPKVGEKSFTCPHCDVLSTHSWDSKKVLTSGYMVSIMDLGEYKSIIRVSKCNNCNDIHIWIDEKMVEPKTSNVPLANSYMPDNVKEIYNEARDVFPESAKASAALLRLALQYLCVELGGRGKNINDDIKKLVQDGLPVKIQQALDIIRVTGNNAVHPGTMDLNDNDQIAVKLFELLNFIVDKMIVQPMEIENLFNDLPEGALEAIEKRDKANT